MVPLWEPDLIRLQTVRAGFPCFRAALIGYVEATRGDDRERNRLCPPNTLPDDLTSWARMQVRGVLATPLCTPANPTSRSWADQLRAEPGAHWRHPARDP